MRGTFANLALLAVIAAAAPARADSLVPAYLTVYVNDDPRGELFVFLDGNDVLARPEDLAGLDLPPVPRSASRREVDGHDYVSLQLVPRLRAHVDERSLSVRISVDPQILPLTAIDLRSEPARIAEPGNDTSFFLNYTASTDAPFGFDGYAESGVRKGNWLLFSSAIGSTGGGVGRGLSQLTYDEQAKIRRWTLGDALTDGDLLGGSLFVGGFQLASNFELDPYGVHGPSLGQSGIAATPSTVEVYVNGALVRRQDIAPGPFSVANLPAPSGSGETRVVIRDALGHEETLTSNYYLPAILLGAGVARYSYTLGLRREGIGTGGWEYHEPVLVASHRYGFTSWFTGGYRAEASPHLGDGGLLLALGLPIGELELDGSLSGTAQGFGAAAAVSYSFRGRSFGGGILARILSDPYESASIDASPARVARELGATLSAPIGKRISVGIQGSLQGVSGGGTNRSVSLTASATIAQNLQLHVTGTAMDGQSVDRVVYAGLAVILGKRTTLGIDQSAHNSGAATSVGMQQTLPAGTGVGYRLQAARDDTSMTSGEGYFEAATDRALLSADVSMLGDRPSARVSVSGGFVVMGGSVFASRPIGRGFGLIRVPGVEGVRVYLDNQEIGRTDKNGDLIVPSLPPYAASRVRIADEDLPGDHTVPLVEQRITTGEHGGTIVTFESKRMNVIRGVVAVGGKAAMFGEIHIVVNGGDRVSPLGDRGQFEVEDLAPGPYLAWVQFDGGKCGARIDVPGSTAPVVDVGQLECAP